jgi:hypothetical protein
MNDPNLIADLIRAGVDPDLISRVSVALIDATIRRQSADILLDPATAKRRAYDRERQRLKRKSADNPPTSAESADIRQHTPLSIVSKKDNNKKERERGSRISADWKPSQDDWNFATGKNLQASQIEIEIEKFRNYWMAKAGNAATKLDWPATWRNWILNANRRTPTNDFNGHAPRPGSREDRQEKTANAIAKLTQFINSTADDSKRGGDPSAPSFGFISIDKPT